MALDRFIIADQGSGQYLCEFSHVDLFLSAILMIEGKVRILSPAWLREKLVAIAERTIENHRGLDEEEPE